MILEFRLIPHKKQRYPTVGDYFKKSDRWLFRITRMKDKRYSIALFLHEVIEFFLCRAAGITIHEIDNFDMRYEGSRVRELTLCGCQHYNEPGDDPHAPYHRQHQVAHHCETLIVEAMGIKWDDYERAVNAAVESTGS